MFDFGPWTNSPVVMLKGEGINICAKIWENF